MVEDKWNTKEKFYIVTWHVWIKIITEEDMHKVKSFEHVQLITRGILTTIVACACLAERSTSYL